MLDDGIRRNRIELQAMVTKIQNHRDLIERIIESVHEGIVLTDELGMIQHVNQRMHDYLGIKFAVGKSFVECCKQLSTLIASSEFQLPQNIIRILQGEQDEFKEQFIFNNSFDELQYFEVFGTGIHNKKNKKREYLFVFYDQTAIMTLDEMKDELISVISHELRTPIASILGFVEILLNREVQPDKQRKYLEIVYKETNRLSNLLNDFLDIQQMESYRQAYTFRLVNFTDLVKDVAVRWQNNPMAINLILPTEEVFVQADAQKITQVLDNLISNAVKYSPGSAKVDMLLCMDKDSIWVQIKDYGLGIPEKDIPHVFTKFFRVKHSERMQIGGTGLGLTICKEIMKAHQGEIAVESIWGEGSKFTIKLPKPGLSLGADV